MLPVSKFSKPLWFVSMTLVYMFLYAPVCVLVLYSFNKGGFPDIWRGFSLQWYDSLFDSVAIWRAFKHSAIVGLTSSFLSVAMALLWVHGARRYKHDVTAIFYSNAMIFDIVLAVGLLALFSYLSIPFGLTTIIAGHTLLGLGFTIPVIKSRYDELDESLIEASLDLGASTQYTFFNVIIPFLYPALLSAFLLAMIVSFDDFLIAFFCSGASVQTLSLYIFSMIRSGITPMVNALSALLLLGSLSMVMIMLMLQRNVLRK